MSKQINIIATLYPKKGKTEEVLTLLQTLSLQIQTSEPFVLRYEIHRSWKPDRNGEEEIVMIERYADKAGLKSHGSSREFRAFNKELGERGLMRGAMSLKMVGMEGGFDRGVAKL